MNDNDDFDKDEFDEFRNFDREELNRLFRERMQDDDFRQRFMGIIGGYQRDYETIMKQLWGMNSNPFSGLSSLPNHNKDSFFKGLDFTSLSEDELKGKRFDIDVTHFFSESMTPEEFYHNERRNQMDDGELPPSVVIDMLEQKLGLALEEENYEEAVTLRDTIKSLREGEKTKNENKTKEK